MCRTFFRLQSLHPSPLQYVLELVPEPPSYSPFATIVHNILSQLHIPFSDVLPVDSDAGSVPWLLPPPSVCLTLTSFSKSTTSSHLFQSLFSEHSQTHNSTPVYTDGSKSCDTTGASVVFPNASYAVPLSQWASNFTAELTAILVALHVILTFDNASSFTIYSDSLSSLQAIKDIHRPHPILSSIRSYLVRLHSKHKHISFCWVPAHCGIPGNERADRLALHATRSPSLPPSLPPSTPLTSTVSSDYYPHLRSGLLREWSRQWTHSPSHPLLHLAFPIPKSLSLPPLPNRFHDVIRTRTLLGHTALTHSHLMTNSPPLPCLFCKKPPPIALHHYLLYCPALTHIRRPYPLLASPSTLTTFYNLLQSPRSSLIADVLAFLHSAKILHSI